MNQKLKIIPFRCKKIFLENVGTMRTTSMIPKVLLFSLTLLVSSCGPRAGFYSSVLFEKEGKGKPPLCVPYEVWFLHGLSGQEKRYVIFWWIGGQNPEFDAETGEGVYEGKRFRFPKGKNCVFLKPDPPKKIKGAWAGGIATVFVKIPESAFCRIRRIVVSPERTGWVNFEGKSIKDKKLDVDIDFAKKTKSFLDAWIWFTGRA